MEPSWVTIVSLIGCGKSYWISSDFVVAQIAFAWDWSWTVEHHSGWVGWNDSSDWDSEWIELHSGRYSLGQFTDYQIRLDWAKEAWCQTKLRVSWWAVTSLQMCCLRMGIRTVWGQNEAANFWAIEDDVIASFTNGSVGCYRRID